jgi:hypothetical protein
LSEEDVVREVPVAHTVNRNFKLSHFLVTPVAHTVNKNVKLSNLNLLFSSTWALIADLFLLDVNEAVHSTEHFMKNIPYNFTIFTRKQQPEI